MILPSASPVSWLLALAAALAYAAPATAASRLGAAASRNALLVAWVLHGALLVWGLWGEAPRFGFAPALSMTAWLVLTVYAVERQLFPQMRARWMLAALGAATIVLALLFPGQPLHVKASAWLPLHLALGIACYGLFAAAVVHAWLMTRAERLVQRHRLERLARKAFCEMRRPAHRHGGCAAQQLLQKGPARFARRGVHARHIKAAVRWAQRGHRHAALGQQGHPGPIGTEPRPAATTQGQHHGAAGHLALARRGGKAQDMG